MMAGVVRQDTADGPRGPAYKMPHDHSFGRGRSENQNVKELKCEALTNVMVASQLDGLRVVSHFSESERLEFIRPPIRILGRRHHRRRQLRT